MCIDFGANSADEPVFSHYGLWSEAAPAYKRQTTTKASLKACWEYFKALNEVKAFHYDAATVNYNCVGFNSVGDAIPDTTDGQHGSTHLDGIEDPLYNIEDPFFYDAKISFFRTE